MKKFLLETLLGFLYSGVMLVLLLYLVDATGYPAMMRTHDWIIAHGARTYSLDYRLNLIVRFEDGLEMKISQKELRAMAEERKRIK